MGVIAHGITHISLSMVDHQIMPIHHVQRSIRCNLGIDRAEVSVVAHDDWIDFVTNESRSFLTYLVVQNTTVPNAVGDQKVALHVFRKVAA